MKIIINFLIFLLIISIIFTILLVLSLLKVASKDTDKIHEDLIDYLERNEKIYSPKNDDLHKLNDSSHQEPL